MTLRHVVHGGLTVLSMHLLVLAETPVQHVAAWLVAWWVMAIVFSELKERR